MASLVRDLLILAAILHRAVAATCFYPNGTNVDDDNLTPCDTSVTFSACCARNDMCTTNGLCKNVGDGGAAFIWRDSCTDSTWQSSSCPQYCYNSTTDPNASSSNWLLNACSQTTYCCSYNNDDSQSCCQDPDRVFDAGPADFLSGNNFQTLMFPATMVTTSTSRSSSFSTSATSSSTTSASPTPTSNQSSGLSTGAEAGIGVGVAFGAIAFIAVAVLGYLLARRRKRSRGVVRDGPPAWSQSQQMEPMVQNYNLQPQAQEVEDSSWMAPPAVEADDTARRGGVPVELDSRTLPVGMEQAGNGEEAKR